MHVCVSSPELPQRIVRVQIYRLVWLNECTCVYIFYICTVYIVCVRVYRCILCIQTCSHIFQTPYVLKRIYDRVAKANWYGCSKVPQQDRFAEIFLTPFSFVWDWLGKSHEVIMSTLYQGKFQTEKVLIGWHCVFSRFRQGLWSWMTIYPNVQNLGWDL